MSKYYRVKNEDGAYIFRLEGALQFLSDELEFMEIGDETGIEVRVIDMTQEAFEALPEE